MSSFLSRLSLVLAVAALPSCNDSTDPGPPPPGPPARIERLVAPSTAMAGDVVTVTVLVTDRNRTPVPGAEIRWIAADGSAVIARPTNLTDANGEAHGEWWLGAEPKTYSMSAHALHGTGVDKSTAAVTTFTIVATPRATGTSGQQ